MTRRAAAPPLRTQSGRPMPWKALPARMIPGGRAASISRTRSLAQRDDESALAASPRLS